MKQTVPAWDLFAAAWYLKQGLELEEVVLRKPNKPEVPPFVSMLFGGEDATGLFIRYSPANAEVDTGDLRKLISALSQKLGVSV